MKNKKGALGLSTVQAVVLGLLTLAIMLIAGLLALTSLQNAGVFTTNSSAANATNYIIANFSSGGSTFFSYVPTFFILLAVVVIILVISVVIIAVQRFSSVGQQESL